MSIKGFNINGQVQKYDYNSLDNLPPQASGLSEEAKQALLACFQNVAWINADGQTYYDALEAALQTAETYTVTNALTGCTTSNSASIVYEGRSYTATITADSGYTLDGATVSITMGGSSVTGFYNNGTISIPNVTGDLVITVTASSSVASISAVFTQGQNVVYTNDSLDSLRQYLVVTATYADSTSETVSDYALSGMLQEGTATITASYGGKTDTFTVVCAVAGWLYRFEQSLASSGSEDFGFTGDEQYATGVHGNDYAYWHNVATEGTSSTDPGAITATSISPVPDFSSDFTLAYWFKDITPNRGTAVSAYNVYSSASTSYSTTGFGTGAVDATGWSLANSTLTKKQRGIRIRIISDGGIDLLLSDTGNSNGRIYNLTYPSTFDTTAWHHYALTRKNSTMYFFVDGVQIMHATVSASIKFGSKIALGSYFDIESSAGALVQTGYGSYFDDFYVSEFCKWTSAFDPSAIVY